MGYGLWVILLPITYYLLPITCLFAWETRETVRVAIFRGAAATVGGEGVSITGLNGNERIPILSNSELEVKAGGDRVLVNGTAYESLSMEARDYHIRVNGRSYRGKVDLLKDNSSLLVINELNLEDYLAGLINHEISSRWPMEAVKAQAVAARTYALYQKKLRKDPRYDLESTVANQVYGGSDREDELALQAVKETEGEVALYNGEPIQALYHSSCGGETEASDDVWGREVPYLKRIKDPYCTEAPNYFWQYRIGVEELGERLRRFGRLGEIGSILIQKRSRSGRVASILIRHSRGSFEISGKEFREALGFENLRSTNFTVKSKGDSFYFAGSGGGHGVGMCQWGAKGMAEDGKSYREILKWYYPGVTVRRIY
jgi:stage II sporulation protein D